MKLLFCMTICKNHNKAKYRARRYVDIVMLISYFLRRFYLHLIIILICLLLIFGSGDLLLRLVLLPSFFSLPIIFLYMLAYMALFSMPIASSMSVVSVISNVQSTCRLSFQNSRISSHHAQNEDKYYFCRFSCRGYI